MIRAPKVKERIYTHVTRRLADGRWVCRGGQHGGQRCDFNSESYADAVTHSTQFGANPPDMPYDSWTST